ncbi:flavodoxin [Harryflintia acetispora]|uniref:flavodoxin n=1 Tax=Harryflintia acetispora TaxID=1849041 RepID=UPI001898E180
MVYFSATGNTRAVAETIAETVDADLYELVPEQPYTDADLDWNLPGSRVNAEHEDPGFRTALAGEPKDLSGYDTVFLGYPLWWRQAPSIVWNFVESSDLAGKTVIPFCTSMSDGIGSSGENLAALAPDAAWLEGRRFGESLDKTGVTQWVDGLGLAASVSDLDDRK